MGYRRPTREPGRAAAEAARDLDAHVDRAQRVREGQAARSETLRRVGLVVRIALFLGSLVVAVVGYELDSSGLKLVALTLFLASLFWALGRLMFRIPPRDGGDGMDGVPPGGTLP
ncbi:MAG: hypothetical protein CMN30_24535 [Sandaracinus sp.]|nr:hypothetical protein [Sandaracinus sp.]